jgi:hypothetical protein
MTENNEQWSIEELVALVDEVQEGEVTYLGKNFNFQWCELTEAEEPKVNFLSPDATDAEKGEWYGKVGTERIIAMISKANDKNPDGITVSGELWNKLPATLRYNITGFILGVKEDNKANFISG